MKYWYEAGESFLDFAGSKIQGKFWVLIMLGKELKQFKPRQHLPLHTYNKPLTADIIDYCTTRRSFFLLFCYSLFQLIWLVCDQIRAKHREGMLLIQLHDKIWTRPIFVRLSLIIFWLFWSRLFLFKNKSRANQNLLILNDYILFLI